MSGSGYLTRRATTMWRRKKKPTAEKKVPSRAAKVKTPPPDEGPIQVALPDGTIEEVSAAMGRSILVPADPTPRGLDARAGAPGWVGWSEFRRRLRGG
jgi:hypothetical protein